jgi:hypothetical protein
MIHAFQHRFRAVEKEKIRGWDRDGKWLRRYALSAESH